MARAGGTEAPRRSCRCPHLPQTTGFELVLCHGRGLNSTYSSIDFCWRVARRALMSIRPDGRPPFRAEHVGSLLRPAALRQAFRRHADKEIDDGEFTRVLDQCIANAVRMQ